MKQNYFLFILIFLTINANAQQASDGYDKFCGNWRWVSGSDTLMIFIKAVNPNYDMSNNRRIVGIHKYIKGGIVKQSRWVDGVNENSQINTTFIAGFIDNDTTFIKAGIFKDLDLNRALTPNFKFNIDGTLTFSLYGKSGIMLGAKDGKSQLPTNIILNRF